MGRQAQAERSPPGLFEAEVKTVPEREGYVDKSMVWSLPRPGAAHRPLLNAGTFLCMDRLLPAGEHTHGKQNAGADKKSRVERVQSLWEC